MQTTTTTDQAEVETSAAPPAGHRLRPARRRRPTRVPADAGGSSRTGRSGRRGGDLTARLRRVRATQAGFDGETRMRRLLMAVLLSELVLGIVLAAAQVWLGLLVALVATAVVVTAIMIFGPHDETAHPEGGALDDLVAGQKEELATLRRRTAAAEASSSLLAELASRHRALLVRQLTQIDQLEAKEADPTALGELFALDHLATRMRRCSEGVLLLAGRDDRRRVGSPVPASEVLRGAVAEVEDFSRVEVSLDRDLEVAGEAVVDVVHLLAELIENATVYSSPTTPVRVRGHVTAEGFAVTVTDQGVGIDAERMVELNRFLASGDVPMTSGQVGFPVVARLAARQGMYVGLTATAEGGTEATVVLPALLVGGHRAPEPLSSAVPPPPAAPPQAFTPASAPVTYAPLPEQSYQPFEAAAPDAPAYEATSYEAPVYPEPSYEEPVYPEPSYELSADPLGVPAADLDDGAEPELAWSMPAVAHPPEDAPSSWDEPSWTETTEPAPSVSVQAPVVETPSADVSDTHAGLTRRIPLTNMAPQITAPDHALADDVASQPTPDRSRHLFAAYRDGLTLGRNGLDDDSARADEDSR